MTNSGPVRDNAAHIDAAQPETPLLKLDDFLPHRLNVLSSLVSQALTRVYGRYGIGIPEWRGLGTPPGDGGVSGQGGGGPSPSHKNKGSRAVGRPRQPHIFSPRAPHASLPALL